MNYPKYTKIYQICFLPNRQMANPQQMYDDVKKQHPGIITKYELPNVSDWNTRMDAIIGYSDLDHVPMLHLDMHGDCNGFGKDALEVIGWDVLIKKITELNQACNGQLFLSLDICKGLNIYHNLTNNLNPLSFKTLGPFQDIYTIDGRIRFTNLYNNYFQCFDMDKSIEVFFNSGSAPPRRNNSFELV